MKTLLLSLFALACIAVSPAGAKNFTIGDDGPVAVVTIPDSWRSKVIEDGVEATSPDKEIYIAIEAEEVQSTEDAVKESIKFFTKEGITIDGSTAEQREMTIGGMKAVSIRWSGRDKDGPTQVSLTFVILDEKNSVLMTYWGTPAAAQKNGAALNAIANSLKPVGR